MQTLGALFTQYFPAVLAIVGTIAIGLGGLSKYREKRMADMLEATTTWKSLAESRGALIADLKAQVGRLEEKVAALSRENQDARDQVHFYWSELQKLKPYEPRRPGPEGL
jgi:hypothetical protein